MNDFIYTLRLIFPITESVQSSLHPASIGEQSNVQRTNEEAVDINAWLGHREGFADPFKDMEEIDIVDEVYWGDKGRRSCDVKSQCSGFTTNFSPM